MDAKVIAIVNQKGGSGKTTITSLLANIMQRELGKSAKILVLDLDDEQRSIFTQRQNEKEMLGEEKIKALGWELYRIIGINSNQLENKIASYKENYDYIFLDLPGNMKQEGVLNCYYHTDYAFIPTSEDSVEITATEKFITTYLEIIEYRKTLGRETQVKLFFNKVNPKGKDFKLLYEGRDQLFDLPFLKSYIPSSKAVFGSKFSTIMPYKTAKKNEFGDFIDEFLTIIFEDKN